MSDVPHNSSILLTEIPFLFAIFCILDTQWSHPELPMLLCVNQMLINFGYWRVFALKMLLPPPPQKKKKKKKLGTETKKK